MNLSGAFPGNLQIAYTLTMATTYSIAASFGKNLAELLALKIEAVYPCFDTNGFVKSIGNQVSEKTYTQRIAIFAEQLKTYLPDNYTEALPILTAILGDENPNETGMFTHYYWLMPIGKFIQEYGLNHFELSLNAIEELTKRNTGEFAIRPYIRRYPSEAVRVMTRWATSPNFHLRRLASEGLRPKLPWAAKLDTFIDNPEPVFSILELLKEDEIMFVKKSVANHLTDWLKVNKPAVAPLISRWRESENSHTRWIIKRATRKITI